MGLFFLLFFSCFNRGTTLLTTSPLFSLLLPLLDLFDTDARDALQLKPEVHLHDVLHCLVRLRDEHVKEQDAKEGATLLTRQLQTRRVARVHIRESELQNRLKDEGGHKLVEKFSSCVHLVATPDNGGKNLEDLLCHKVIVRVLFQTVYAVLEYLRSETPVPAWVHTMYISDSAESDYQVRDA